MRSTKNARRSFLLAGASTGLLAGVGAILTAFPRFTRAASVAASEKFEVMHTDAEWHSLLSSNAYAVLRQEGTEHPYTSPLNAEHRAGIFACAGCARQLFSSKTKFESGTGWPSFWQPLDKAIGTHEDRSFGSERTEVHCQRCGGHLGHVFDDGPAPTGLRYCMNGVAMTFTPAV